MHDKLLNELVETYFQSRPNLHKPRNLLSIFFLACSGAGKSTLRKTIVEKLGATYVCNDEVRALLEAHPIAIEHGVLLKEIVANTWQKIITEASNKMVVFDNNIIQYYMYPDSYLQVSIRETIPNFVICVDIPATMLKQRVIDRAINAGQILEELPGQLVDYEKAKSDVPSDWVLSNSSTAKEVQSMLKAIAQRQ